MSNNYLEWIQDTSLIVGLSTAGKPLMPGGNISPLGNPASIFKQ